MSPPPHLYRKHNIIFNIWFEQGQIQLVRSILNIQFSICYYVKRLCKSVHVLPTVPGPSWNYAQTLEGALVTDGGQNPCYCVLTLIILADSWFLFEGFERTWRDFKCYCDPELISYTALRTSSNRLSTKTNLNQSLVPGARGYAWEKSKKLTQDVITTHYQPDPPQAACVLPKSHVDNLG